MQERSKQRQPVRPRKRWVINAIAAPALLWMMWGGLPERRLQPDGHQSPREALVQLHRASLLGDLGMIAAVAGVALLLLKLRTAKADTPDLSLTDFCGADLGGSDFSGVNLNGANFNGANLINADLSGAALSSATLNGTALIGANLSGADLNGVNLIGANLNGADLSGATLRYANLSGADLRYANLSDTDFSHANLSDADLNCALLTNANLSDANLSEALLFFLNSRAALNLEPFQLKAKPSPFLCHIALPAYAQQPPLNPNRDCDRIPQLLSDRYDISLEEAQGIVEEAWQHRWD